MKLLIKQRVFSWTDTYDVYDEYDEPKYFVKAEMFRLTHQIHIYDRDRNEIGMIKQRFFTLMPTFDIEINGRRLAVLRKNLPFLSRSITSTTTVGAVRVILCLGTTAFTRLAVWLRRFQKSCSVGEILMLSTMQTRETKFWCLCSQLQ